MITAADIIALDISLAEEAIADARRHVARSPATHYGTLYEALDAARDYAQAAQNLELVEKQQDRL